MTYINLVRRNIILTILTGILIIGIISIGLLYVDKNNENEELKDELAVTKLKLELAQNELQQRRADEKELKALLVRYNERITAIEYYLKGHIFTDNYGAIGGGDE